MEKHSYKLTPIIFIFHFFLSSFSLQATSSSLLTYIVHVHPSPAISTSFLTSEEREEWYKTFLPTNIANSGEPRLIYSYHNVISGFSVRLTEEELAEMERKPGFLQAYPDRMVPLLTTHAPKFLGLHQHEAGLWNNSNFGKGIVVRFLDTGVESDHLSFHDNGVIPPPPAKWKGSCC